MCESQLRKTHLAANTATCFGLPSAKHNCSLPQAVSGSNISTEITIMESELGKRDSELLDFYPTSQAARSLACSMQRATENLALSITAQPPGT